MGKRCGQEGCGVVGVAKALGPEGAFIDFCLNSEVMSSTFLPFVSGRKK